MHKCCALTVIKYSQDEIQDKNNILSIIVWWKFPFTNSTHELTKFACWEESIRHNTKRTIHNLAHTIWAHHVRIRILPGISHFTLGHNVIFVMVYFYFLWLLTFLKISMTSPGLEISHSNSMTFSGFSWSHEPCKEKLFTHHELVSDVHHHWSTLYL